MTTAHLLIAVLLFVLLLLVALLLWRHYARQQGAAAPDTPHQLTAASFRAAMATLYPGDTARDRYDSPCVLVCGDAAADKAAWLRGAGLAPVDGADALPSGWWTSMDGDAFVLPDEAWSADQGNWHACLRLLDSHRPRRPLDALLWMLPMASLMAADGSAEASAARLCRKLFDLQTRLGLSVPVYVVLSGSEQLPGFGHFAELLPKALWPQSLGWSNPEPRGAAYRLAAGEQGVGELVARVRALAVEMGAIQPGGDFDRVYLLSEQLAARLAALPAVLQAAMRPNATLAPLDLRGFYLCGQAGDPAALQPDADSAMFALQPPAPAPPAAPVLFCRQLFAERICGEFGLARLVPRKLAYQRAARRYSLIGAALLSLLWIAFLPSTHRHLSARSATMLKPLHDIKYALEHALPAGETGGAYNKESTTRLIGEIDAVPEWSVSSAALPLSWGGPSALNERLLGALKKYYQYIVLSDINHALDQRGACLAADGAADPAARGRSHCPTASPALAAIGDAGAGGDQHFQAFRKFVSDTQTYELNRHRLGQLVSTGVGTWAEAAHLLEYLFDLRMTVRSAESVERFDAIIRAIEHTGGGDVTLGRDQIRFRAKLQRLHGAMLAHRFTNNKVDALSKAVSAGLAALDHQGHSDPGVVSKLRADIFALQQELASAPVILVNGQVEMAQAYSAVLDKVRQTDLLGSAVRDQIGKEAEQAVTAFHAAVLAASEGKDAPLALDAGKRMVLSPDIAALSAAFTQLQRFAFDEQAGGHNGAGRIQGLVNWNASQLEAARVTYQDYLAYETSTLPKAPPRFQNALRQYARLQAAGQLDRDLARAVQPLPGLDWRTANFDQARQAMPPLLAGLRTMGQPLLADAWQSAMDRQAQTILEQIQGELDRRNLFLPDAAAVRNWNGSRMGALQAYGAFVPADLAANLAAQIDEVNARADAAKPARLWLETAPAEQRHAARATLAAWTRLDAELARYAGKNPASTLRQLEQFISEDLNAIDSANCGDKLVRLQYARNVDYFQRQGQVAAARFSERCTELQTQTARKAYEAIAEFYNAFLRGKYPFAAKLADPPAAPERVRHLLRLLDTHHGEVRAWLERQPELVSADAREFIERLNGVRPLLGAIVQTDAVNGAPAALDLWPEFRINRAREDRADQILAWEVDTGKARAAPGAAIAWRQGDPLAVRLRWAQNSELAPADGDARVPGMQTEDKQASWHYGGPWALVKLMAQHAAAVSELDSSDSQQPQVLRFAVPVRKAKGEPAGITVAYGRLGVSVHGKPERLALPPFPTDKAPPAPPPRTGVAATNPL